MIIGRVISLLRNKRARIFLKLYEPFVYSLCLCILSITYTCDYFSEEPIITQEEYDRRAFILSLIGGCSLFTIARIISYSSGLCKWYMANIACLLLNNLSGFAKYLNIIDSISYMFIGTRIWKPLSLQFRGWKMRGSAATLVFRCIFWWFPDWHFRLMTQNIHPSKMCFPSKIHV